MDFKSHRFHSDDEWLQIIQECRSSGLNDAAWCHQNGIPTSSFYTAVKRCRNKACTIPDATDTIHNEKQEVVPISFNEPFTTYPIRSEHQELTTNTTIQIVVNDYKIQLTNGCAKEVIKNTLLALREIC